MAANSETKLTTSVTSCPVFLVASHLATQYRSAFMSERMSDIVHLVGEAIGLELNVQHRLSGTTTTERPTGLALGLIIAVSV